METQGAFALEDTRPQDVIVAEDARRARLEAAEEAMLVEVKRIVRTLDAAMSGRAVAD